MSPRPARRRVVAAGLVLAVAVAAALGGCSTSEDPDPDRRDEATVSNSPLDREGVQQIEESGSARFDLRDLTLTRSDVGLPENRMGPIVGRPGGREIDLVLRAPEGEERVATSTFSATFFSSADTADAVTWFESYDTEADGLAALDEAVERWGLPREAVATWREALTGDGEQEVSLTPGVSPSGFVTQVTARGEKGAGQTHQWTVLLDPRYYEDGALERIRETGKLPTG
ncbi:hypothetical protein ASG49_08930 [Marmoricola sp. Leaf446]|uniref:hypothetical protein n=1 Tax=Marmoricola sp. Leaf446 TaxID=1736379 RepID=UPI0007125F89|nr:hypothetical protein [Marmoricola sp. Leaf446]KQT92082.1 hypothetical protein ASG49_08930 [Marmoricola sp. Leaf446]